MIPGSTSRELRQGFALSALCIGTVTKNTVDAAVEVAYETRSPIMLIASRNQLDLSTLEPGYVGWSTETFAEYMTHCDPHKFIPLCRDHGGPWQHSGEVHAALDEERALSSALASLKADVDAGFDALHIDTSATLSGEISPDLAIKRLIIIYSDIVDYIRQINAAVEFEIGFEEQQAELQAPEEFEAMLSFIMEELAKHNLPKPLYVVTQTGTKVAETGNVGVITDHQKQDEVKSHLSALSKICSKHGVRLKAHNCDYLSAESWRILSEAHIGGINVAPEYGVAETRAFLDILHHAGWHSTQESFLQIAYDSGKWKKWVTPATTLDDYQCAVIAGHYVFTRPEVVALRRTVGQHLFHGTEAMDHYLKQAVKAVILQHLNWYRPAEYHQPL